MGAVTLKKILPLMLVFAGLGLAQKAPGFDIGALDRSADPCVNFYKFSCGGWKAANPLPGDQARFGRFNDLQERNRAILQNILETNSANKATRSSIEQKIGDFYFACMDEKTANARGLAPIKPEMDRINSIKDKKELAALMAHFYRIGVHPLFGFGSEQDARDASKIIAGVDQAGINLPDRDYYLKTDEKSVALRKQYVEHVAKMFQLAGIPAAEAVKRADAVMALETELAKGSLDRVSRRDPEKLYHVMKVSELAALAPGFDWATFFKGVGAPPVETLNVAVPPFMEAMQSVLDKTSLADLKSYFTWQLVHENVQALPDSFLTENFNFYGKALTGQKEMKVRWKRCVDMTDANLPDALGRKFIEKTLGEEGIRRTAEMVAGIDKAFQQVVESLSWMTPKTKEQALVKLHAVMNKIGNQEKWLDYATVRITRDDFFANGARASEFDLARNLAKIGKPVDKTEWFMSPPTVNAYYDPQKNNINFPAGILQPPFWDNKMEDAVNYGAIGSVIGHELTHGFDDQGRQFDAAGNLRDWWTAEDAKAFQERAECIVNQYSGYSPVDDLKINGKLTLGENTADNGGVRIAYMALIEKLAGKQPEKIDGFTPQQRFFLGFAQVWCENTAPEELRRRVMVDPHSAGEFRVNGVVSNMPEFANAFSCKEGQPMVRGAQSCRVW